MFSYAHQLLKLNEAMKFFVVLKAVEVTERIDITLEFFKLRDGFLKRQYIYVIDTMIKLQ